MGAAHKFKLIAAIRAVGVMLGPKEVSNLLLRVEVMKYRLKSGNLSLTLEGVIMKVPMSLTLNNKINQNNRLPRYCGQSKSHRVVMRAYRIS